MAGLGRLSQILATGDVVAQGRGLIYDEASISHVTIPMQYLPNQLERNAEASRYALLRRVSPAMRHQMAGSFQPVTMMAAIIEKRLLAASPNLPALAKTSNDVRTLATAATRSSLDLMGWIAPDPDARVPLDKGIDDALHLVATELSFRGFKCANLTQGVVDEVALSHARGVFVAAVLALTDAAAAPATVRLTARREGNHLVVTIALTDRDTAAETAPNEESQLILAAYRKIDWSDVEAMATAEGVSVQNTPTQAILRVCVAAS
jgi:hypothetical protein